MKRLLCLLLSVITLSISTSTPAQVIPLENRMLNYRIIGFAFPPKNGVNYLVEIARGNYVSDELFESKIDIKVSGKENKLIAEVPDFGALYTWRIVYLVSGATVGKSELYHFSVGKIPEVDTNSTRLRIMDAAVKYNDAYVLFDGNKVMYDMNGKPVWFLPQVEGKDMQVGDLKMSPQGTITFLANGQAFEINYDGVILWKAPNDSNVNGNGLIQSYHHEFTRLKNGHYMVLGTEFLACRLPSLVDSSMQLVPDDKNAASMQGQNLMKLRFGMIIEYDEHGKVVWSWKTSKYYQESDIIKRRQSNGFPFFDLHENSFYFDEEEQAVYLSCKRISRVVKIKYPEGTVSASYGDKYDVTNPQIGNELFCGQHSIRHSSDGNIFMFDNNVCNPYAFPKLEKFHESSPESEKLIPVWEYQFTADITGSPAFPHGGNVEELPDHCVFACMGSNYSKTVIVDNDKKVLWSSLPEKWDDQDKKWIPIPQYRASLLKNRKEIERLIWNAEKDVLSKTNQVPAAKKLNLQ